MGNDIMIQESKSNILLMTKDRNTVDMLNAVVNKNSREVVTTVCQEIPEFTNYLRNMPLQVAVVDIDPDPLRILRDLDTITTMYPETHVVVVSSRFDKELVLQAMQSGARDFISKETVSSGLNGVLERLKNIVTNGAESRVKSGSIVSVISAGGGCGATTVAINLANELRITSSEAVLMIDLDDYYSTISSYLGISAEYGISDILAYKDPIDENLVKSCAYNYMRDFHVLINHNGSEFPKPEMPRNKNISPVLEACKKAYKYTVIDAPRLNKDAIEDLADISEFAVIVFQLTIKDVKFARTLIALLQSRIHSEKIILLANRFDKRNSLIRLEDAKRVLGSDRVYRIRSSWHKIANSINCGKLLAEVAPRSKLRRDFQELTSTIIEANCVGTNGEISG
jgi:pilus assembly protein CpaE